MDKWGLLRRTIHLMIGFTPLYYALPDELPIIGTDHWVILFIGLLMVAVIEGVRLSFGLMFPGLRPYERHQVASYVWASVGVLVALWLMPSEVGTVCIVGMAVTDPIAGELRKRYRTPMASILPPIAIYGAICLTIMVQMTSWTWELILIMCAVGSVSAILSERWKTKYLDDDFLMIVVPGILMTALALTL
ncbi:MAG: hypothetical protein MUO84_04310 [Thermoplasmata archaeon]|nr:hypothetical protein [Thermoplasmata archaeon]